VVAAERMLTLDPHANYEFSATELLGSFFDITYAYRFGPPGHTVSVATLTDVDSGEQLAECFHFPAAQPSGRDIRPRPIEMQTRVEQHDSQWQLSLRAAELALFVQVEDEHFRAEDNWFHLLPNQERRIKLLPRNATVTTTPNGEVRAVNSLHTYRYRSSQ
jgi:beta-mannosidase